MSVASRVNRREFLGFGLGLFGSHALGGIVTSMEGRMSPVSTAIVEPWNEGVLRRRTFSLAVGALAPFRAVHFSDTHVNLSDIEEMHRSAANYRAGVRRYARFPQAIPSFYATLDFAAAEPGTLLLHTGDLIDFGTRAAYGFVRHNVSKLDGVFAIGNHEYECADSSYDPDVAARRRQFAEAGVSQNLERCSRIVNGVNFVAFDNAVRGRGGISPETRNFVLREFGRGLPVVLMCHVPPYLSKEFRESALQGKVDYALQQGLPQDVAVYMAHSRNARWCCDAETESFWRRIREQNSFKAVLCGHCHWPWDEPFGCGRLIMAGGNYEGCLNEIRFS